MFFWAWLRGHLSIHGGGCRGQGQRHLLFATPEAPLLRPRSFLRGLHLKAGNEVLESCRACSPDPHEFRKLVPSDRSWRAFESRLHCPHLKVSHAGPQCLGQAGRRPGMLSGAGLSLSHRPCALGRPVCRHCSSQGPGLCLGLGSGGPGSASHLELSRGSICGRWAGFLLRGCDFRRWRTLWPEQVFEGRMIPGSCLCATGSVQGLGLLARWGLAASRFPEPHRCRHRMLCAPGQAPSEDGGATAACTLAPPGAVVLGPLWSSLTTERAAWLPRLLCDQPADTPRAPCVRSQGVSAGFTPDAEAVSSCLLLT